MADSNEDRVYVFDNVRFETGGREWCVSSLVIILQENAIPTVRIVVDPVHTPAEPMAPATSATLSEIAGWHKDLQKLANDKATANLSLEVHKRDGLEQELDLKDWIVTSAGIVSVKATGAFALEVEIQHPLCLCDYAGMYLGSFIENLDFAPNDLSSTDILAALYDALDKYLSTAIDETTLTQVDCYTGADPGAATASAMIKDFIDKLHEAADQLIAHLEWSPDYHNNCGYSNWPLELCLGTDPTLGLNEIVVSAVGDYVVSALDTNLWDVISKHICPQWYVSVIPTYWENKLKLVPFTPWNEPSITFVDTDISDVVFPGADPGPLSGTIIRHKAPALGGDYTSFVPVASDKEFNMDGVLFVPNGEVEGGLVMLESPHWLKALEARAASYVGEYTSPPKVEPTGKLKTAANTAYGTTPAAESGISYEYVFDIFRGALYYCAWQTFLTKFRQGVEASVHTRLLMTSTNSNVPGGWVCPGHVCSVKKTSAAGAGEVVFDMYITGVVHEIDCQRSTASTEITGRYARPAEGFMDVAKNGMCNPVYTN